MVICKLKTEQQKDIIDWAIGAMESLPDDDMIELWGAIYDDCPVKISKSNELIIETKDVAEDLLYRLETQYVSMAADESKEEYKKAINLVFSLSNKIRPQYEMPTVTRSEIKSLGI